MLCSAAALTWASVALTNLLHRSAGPVRAKLHAAKLAVPAGGCGIFLAPLLLWLPDFYVLQLVVGTNCAVVVLLKLVNDAIASHSPAFERQSTKRESRRSSFVGGGGDAWSTDPWERASVASLM